MINPIEALKDIGIQIEDCISTVETIPNIEAISELISTLEVIDNHYKNWCSEIDKDYGEPEGTTYEEGIYLEYEIEADVWHNVSVALRKLKNG